MTSQKIISIIEARRNSTTIPNRNYNQAIDDILQDIYDAMQKELNGEMTELGERNYELIREGVRCEGSYDPNEIYFMFEERLYTHEAETIWNFLDWVHNGKKVKKYGRMISERAFGRGNYEERFQEFLNDREYQDSLIQDEQRYEDQHKK